MSRRIACWRGYARVFRQDNRTYDAAKHAMRQSRPEGEQQMETSREDYADRYVVHMDDKFGSLALIDVGAEANAVTVPWFNQTLTTVNDALVRLGVFCGEYHWHKHDDQDEFFLVIDGELYLDVEGREGVVLQKHQGYTVPKGVVHRTRAPKRCVCVMIEQAGIVPTGD